MSALAAVTCLFACAYCANRLYALVASGRHTNSPIVPLLSVWPLLFVAVLQGAFHVLGFFELASGRPVVAVGSASLVALMGAALAELIWRRRRRKVHTVHARQVAAELWQTLRGAGLGGYLAGAIVLLLILMTALQFPRGFEVAAYHLPIGLHIFQAHSFAPWDSTYFHAVPASASLFYAFLLQFLPERPTSAVNFLFAAVLCIGAYGLAQSVGADRKASVLAVAGLVTVPMVAFSVVLLSGDVGGLAFLAVALYLLFARPFASRANLVLAGMAMGLAYGFKMYHAPSVAYAFVLVALGVGAARDATMSLQTRTRDAFGSVGWFALGALLTAGYWFARAYYHFGNPTYPLGLPLVSKLFGWYAAPDGINDPATDAPIWVDNAWEWFTYPWLERHRDALGFTQSAGLGPFVAAAVPIAIAATATLLAVGAARERGKIAALWLGIPLVLTAWWFSAQQPRYAIAALVYATPLVAYMISRTEGACRSSSSALLAACIAVAAVIVLSKEAIGFGDRIILSRQFSRSQFYEYPPSLDRLPAGSTIGYIGMRSGHYPLFGPRHDLRVVSYPEMMRRLGLPGQNPNPKILWPYPIPPQIELPAAVVRDLRLTHLHVNANTEIRPGPCVDLQQIDVLERNPYNQQPLPAPRRLFRVSLCDNPRPQ